MMKKLFLILMVVLFSPCFVYAATVYVKDDPNNTGTKVCYKAGGWADATCSDGTGNTTLTAAHTAAGANGTLIIAAGTYLGTQGGGGTYGVFATGATGVTTRATLSSDPLDGGVSRTGTVHINGNNEAKSPIRTTHANCVFTNLTVSGAGSGYSALHTGASGITYNDLVLSLGNGAGVGITGDPNSSDLTGTIFNRCTFSGIKVGGWGAKLRNPIFNYCKYKAPVLTLFNFEATFNNCLFTEATGGIFSTNANSGAAVTWNNCIFYGNSLSSTATHILTKTNDQTWTLNNCIALGNPLNADDYNFNGVTWGTGNLRGSDPKFVANKYPSVLSFASDDSANIDWFYNTVAPKLEAHGFYGTIAVGSTSLTADQVTKLLALEAAGHDVAVHAASHTDVSEGITLFTILQTGYTCGADSGTLTCTDGAVTDTYTLSTYTLDALRTQMGSDGYTVGALTANYTNVPSTVIGYIPAGTSITSAYALKSIQAPITISKAATTIEIGAGTLTTSTPHTYTLSNYTVATLRTALIADGYTMSAVSGGWDGTPATALHDIPSGTSIATTLPLVMDSTRAWDWQVDGAWHVMHDTHGLNPTSFVCPLDGTSAGLQRYILNSGHYTGARGGVNAPYTLSSANAYNIPDMANTSFTNYDVCVAAGGTQAECIARVVTARISKMATIGEIRVFLAHNEDEFDADEWEAMLDAVQQSGIQVKTLTQLATYIKTYDPSDDIATADNMTYTRTLADESNYALQATSPAINKGKVTGLTTDFISNPVPDGCGPDIGLYEYVGSPKCSGAVALLLGY